MPLDIVGEGVLSVLLRVVFWVARTLLFLIIDVGFHMLCRPVGWVMIKTVTVGYYPKESIVNEPEGWFDWVALFGFIGLALVTFITSAYI